jgi:UDP-N-acetylmuramate dehydrogenase
MLWKQLSISLRRSAYPRKRTKETRRLSHSIRFYINYTITVTDTYGITQSLYRAMEYGGGFCLKGSMEPSSNAECPKFCEGGFPMEQLISDLQAADIGEIRENEPLAPYTTWKIGGPADVLVIPKDKGQLVSLIRILHLHNTPWTIIGRGSNLLVTDKGVRGVVIKLGDALETLRFEDTTVYAGASYSLIKLSVLAAKEGLTGLEFAGGIPGSVGGAIYMNAGAHGSDISRILKQAEVILNTGELVTMQAEELHYAYRHSILHQKPGIVTEAVFELEHGDRKEIAGAMAAYRDRRLRTQPLQLACAGSVFRNPENEHAAKLIEEAGLKGMRVGGAEVSPLHANFIVNTGNATAVDVLTLIQEVQHIIHNTKGITLVPEVLVVGER